LTTVIKV